MIEWLIYQLPWWAQASLLAVVWAAISVVVGTLFGWKYARMMMWPVVALIAAFAVYRKAQQQGYADRIAHEEKALDKAETIVVEKREEIQGLPDDQLDERADRWTKF